MARCPSCEYPLPENRERVGARCPSCRDPLYEPPGRFARTAHEGEAVCAAHPKNESIGPCSRCGNYLCEICRTRWRDQILCAACIERALASDEATPETGKGRVSPGAGGVATRRRHAWVIALLALVFFVVAASSSEPTIVMAALFVLGLIGAAAPAVFSIGQGVSVLRARGNHMIMATIGVTLGGLYVGVLMGIFVLSIWQA